MKQKTETAAADFTATKDELKKLLKKIKGEESDSREFSDARREFKVVLARATPHDDRAGRTGAGTGRIQPG